MQQPMASIDAKRADDHVDRFAHCKTIGTQTVIMLRGLDRDQVIEHWRHRIAPEIPFEPRGMGFVSGTLKHLQQYQITNKNLIVSLEHERSKFLDSRV
jgi:hypothetical protein